MADPIKALADAARSTCFQGLTNDAPFRLIPSEPLRGNLINLRKSLAAYDAAQANPATTNCACCDALATHVGVDMHHRCEDHRLNGDESPSQPAPTDATTPPTDDYDALGHAMEILGRCVTKYSCEQAQAVAKVLRQWRDKWALAVDSIPVAQPAPTDAEIREAIRRYGLAEFQFGKGAPVDDVVERHAEQKASLANLLALIARLRGGAR